MGSFSAPPTKTFPSPQSQRCITATGRQQPSDPRPSCAGHRHALYVQNGHRHAGQDLAAVGPTLLLRPGVRQLADSMQQPHVDEPGVPSRRLALRRPDVGVLVEGAKADIVVFDGTAPNMIGWVNPVAAVMLHSNVKNVQHVMVNGNFKKRDINLTVGDDYAEAQQRFLN